MRVDHFAYRLPQGKRDEAAAFFINALGYKKQAEFEIYFNDEKTDKAVCLALEPPEKTTKDMPWEVYDIVTKGVYYMSPEIFLSEGSPGSIVDNWVKARGGYGGIHHVAMSVSDVEATMKEWQEKGWANFSSEKPMVCDGLTQVFSKPNCTGVIYEFIKREKHGFCSSSVKELMLATKGD